jgi:hypothetical protein
MKKILAALLLLSTATFAQDRRWERDQPPVTIRHAFDRDYSNHSDAQWTRTSSNWHASYRDNNNRNVDAYYDRRGNRIATHREIDRSDIPSNLDERIRNMYSGDDNYNIMRIERPNSTPLFQVRFQLGSGSRTVYMDAQGRTRQYHAPY